MGSLLQNQISSLRRDNVNSIIDIIILILYEDEKKRLPQHKGKFAAEVHESIVAKSVEIANLIDQNYFSELFQRLVKFLEAKVLDEDRKCHPKQ